MKIIPFLLLATLAAGSAMAAAPGGDDIRFAPFGTDYKKPQVLPDNFFNPFKEQADAAMSKREGPGVTTESVADAIGHRGVSGIVFAPGGKSRLAIIGDEVFGIGDELSFGDAGKPDPVPLVAGATVVLREVGKASLGFEVIADGEAVRHVNFPLRNFWKP